MAKPLKVPLGLAAVPTPASRVLNDSAIAGLIKRWKRGTALQADLADRWQKVLDGRVFAVQGERDIILFQLASQTADEFPDLVPEEIAGFFENSLSLMEIDALNNGEDPITKDLVIAKFRTACEKRIELSEAVIQEENERRKQEIHQAFGRERDAYSSAELIELADRLNIMPTELDKCWVFVHGGHYYLWNPAEDTYSVQTESSLLLASKIALSPTGIDMTRQTSGGGVRGISKHELLECHATAVNSVSKSLTHQHPTFDWHSKTLVLPAARRRELEPEYSEEIDHWLDLLGGQKLKDWLSLLTTLDQPTCALVMIGSKGAGKSLLAMGCSRLWTTKGPTQYSDVIRYNQQIAECPLILGDEGLPKDYKGNTDTGSLRQLVQSTARSIDVKYGPKWQLNGAIRLILAANNDGILAIEGHQNADDIAAVAERFFTIRVGPEIEQYLNSIGGRAYIDREWVQNDALARHIVFLTQNPVPWVGRFGIEHDSESTARKMALKSGLRTKICEWIVRNGLAGRLQGIPGVSVSDAGVLLGIKALTESWGLVFDGSPPPTTIASQALQEISCEVRSARCLVSIDTLLAWLDLTRYADPIEFLEGLLAE